MSNTQLLSRLLVFFLMAVTLLACDPENIDDTFLTPVFDCPDLELNEGDACLTNNPSAPNEEGVVNENCECEAIVDCPDYNANIGDECTTGTVNNGTVNADCECQINNDYDCPDLGLNIGDECTTGTVNNGTVNADCECES